MCTVHPVVCYFKRKTDKDDYETTHLSMSFLSEELDHGVPMVYAIQSKVISILKDNVEDFYLVEYFTDGCAEQYKNYKHCLS